MKVVHCIAGTRVDHGGTSRSVPALCDALNACDVETHLLHGVPADPGIQNNELTDSARDHRISESPWFGRWFVGTQFEAALRILNEPSVPISLVHDHGIWLGNNHAVASFCSRSQLARVVSPRGMLSSWSIGHHHWKKKFAWTLFQKKDLQKATAFHATSDQEADEVRSLGFSQPIAVIPNGVDFPAMLSPRSYRPNVNVLFMSRVHPKKGLLMLVDAWKKAGLPEDWKLTIAGPDESGHRSEVEQAARSFGILDQVRFLGEVPDEHKWKIFETADLFVLPSFNENFGIVIAEALAAGLPVITTTSTPWGSIRDRGLGWWIEPDVPSLVNALRDAAKIRVESPDRWLQMGRTAAEYVRATYSWEKSARSMKLFYEWLSDADTVPPDFVRRARA